MSPTDDPAHDLAALDATAQAALVRSGEVSPLELIDAAIERIERLNPVLNAVVWTRFDEARSEALARRDQMRNDPHIANAPFVGVPFLLKDIGATQAGLPYWMGNSALRDAGFSYAHDTELGDRFRRAGLITVGKTNLPELGSSPTTQPPGFGPTNNPWDPTRSPSGSSGGSAAAVASGMVPIAHANDGGGSTRLPASWNGLVGLKASRGRMPNPEIISRLTTELVVTRTVRDTAAALDATHGATEADLYQLAPPLRPYVEELGADPGRLRIALCTDGGGYDIDPECVLAAESAANALSEAGHHVEVVTGEVLFGGDGKLNGKLWMANMARRVDAVSDMLGRPVREDECDPYNWAAAQRGKGVPAAEWTRSQELQQAWVNAVFRWMAPWDILVSPTSGCPPLRTTELAPDLAQPWKIGHVFGRVGRFTLPFNATGHPAISLPLHWTPDGLPVGVQLVAKMGREDLLLRLASWFENAMPWASRRPAEHAGKPS
jgi:amidase